MTKRIAEFHQTQNIKGSTPLKVKLKTLGLDLKERHDFDGESMTLSEITKDLIRQMNEAIKKRENEPFTRDKRLFRLEPSDRIQSCPSKIIERILQSLVDQKIIYNYYPREDGNYTIQA